MRLCTLLALCLLTLPAAAQFTVESAGPCAAEGLSGSVKAALQAEGYRVKDSSGGVFVEAWLSKAIPADESAERRRGSDFPFLAPQTLVGVIRYVRDGADFRGQPIQPGVYTMRYNVHPEDGDHQGVAPRRDFVLLTPVTVDQDAGAKLTFEAMVAMSRKASGTNHPSVLFLEAPESGAKFPGVHHNSDNHDVLQLKSGKVELGIVVVGKSEG